MVETGLGIYPQPTEGMSNQVGMSGYWKISNANNLLLFHQLYGLKNWVGTRTLVGSLIGSRLAVTYHWYSVVI